MTTSGGVGAGGGGGGGGAGGGGVEQPLQANKNASAKKTSGRGESARSLFRIGMPLVDPDGPRKVSRIT